MPDFGHETAFGMQTVVFGVALEDLQGNFTFESCIPRPKDLAETALPNHFDNLEVTPKGAGKEPRGEIDLLRVGGVGRKRAGRIHAR
jgi:hypothetical protein